MLHNLTGWHALIVVGVVLLLFGAAKLPALARSVGQSMKIVKEELREDAESDAGRLGAAPGPMPPSGGGRAS